MALVPAHKNDFSLVSVLKPWQAFKSDLKFDLAPLYFSSNIIRGNISYLAPLRKRKYTQLKYLHLSVFYLDLNNTTGGPGHDFAKT